MKYLRKFNEDLYSKIDISSYHSNVYNSGWLSNTNVREFTDNELSRIKNIYSELDGDLDININDRPSINNSIGIEVHNNVKRCFVGIVINKVDDDWYYVKLYYIISEKRDLLGEHFYKCDTIDGLIDLLKSIDYMNYEN